MTWLGTDIDGPIVAARALHLGAAAVTAGGLIFREAVAEPALRCRREASASIGSQIRWLAWTGLPIVVVSGFIWAVLLTEQLSDEGFGEAVTSGALRDVMTLTQFGIVMQVRLGVAIVLAIGLAFDRSAWGRWLGLGAALGLTASVAWTGHAGSTPHALGYLHLAADALHSCAAAAWVGGLPPLALLLRACSPNQPIAAVPLELEAVRRFSMLGIASVATLILSGIINTWILVGSWRGLITNAYGWLLMMKLAVFAVMLMFAAVNRTVLTPGLALPPGSEAQGRTVHRLMRNTVVEFVLGLLVLAIVGMLGTLHPAAHLVN
ncbi:MAG: copper homeostasis membrane protein CopD [Bradyrhizobium sp.]|uniref:copper homeostasis membrane protein CopD n=1 Tax=Bradyrhizobium sp. TaxID=376 RepID=UPI001D7421B9|nr:copper homeostasis membrane protein CopD [Bradyrhizobium sp.]MBV9564012.1 copper homeostasis membrane protein CopD [Bradyrhizobium sp.]